MIRPALTILALLPAPAGADGVTSPVGLWATQDDQSGATRALVRIALEDGRLSGVVERIFLRPDEGEDPVCTRCEGERRGRRVVGMDVLRGLEPDGEAWAGGTVLDPRTGSTYGARVWLDSPDLLKVRGYRWPFYRTQTWRRASPGGSATPVGSWETLDDVTGTASSIVEIRQEGGALCGKVVRIILRPDEGPDPVCLRCTGSRHGQRVIGMTILWDHRLAGSRWVDGRVLDPENGKEYASSLWLDGPDSLRVRGRWGPFFRTQTWRRVGANGVPPDGTGR